MNEHKQILTDMRNIASILILLVAFNSFGAFHPGTITYKNGKSRAGFIEAKLGDVVRFKPWVSAEEEQIISSGLKAVTIKTDSGRQQHEYYYLSISGQKKVNAEWLKLVEKGIVSLYVHETVSQNHAGVDEFVMDDFYCLRAGESSAKQVSSYDNNHVFRSKAPLYFADCPQLVEKIKSKQYSWLDIESVVKQYNQWQAISKRQLSNLHS